MTYKNNAPLGLQPVRMLDGSDWNGGYTEYNITSGYATSLFTGDPVTLLANGTIGVGVAGSAIVGVFQGCEYMATDGVYTFFPYWAASTATLGSAQAKARVIANPNVVFTIQETNGSGAAGTALALADRGLNANFYAGAGGSTAMGTSSFSLDNATEDTTATLNLKILDLDPSNPSGTVGSFANWLVLINNHILQRSTGSLGV